MKFGRTWIDRSGKTAFAYLAVLLMVLTSAFISYMVRMERTDREAEISSRSISLMTEDLDSLESDLRTGLIELHDRTFLDLVTKPDDWNSTRLDGAIESKISVMIEEEINRTFQRNLPENGEWRYEVDDLSISIVPLPVSFRSPTTSVKDTAPNGTGPWTYGWRPGAMGTNTSISIVISCSTPNKGVSLVRTIDVNIVRESLTDLLYQRMERLMMALEGPEMAELFQHMIGTVSEAKAYLGRGRSMSVSGGPPPGPLLTDDEISACMDLSVHLLSKAYLGVFDDRGLLGIENELRSVEGSFGSSPGIRELLSSHEGAIDPGMLALIIEGSFSEKAPPDAEDLLRPLLFSLLERLALGLVDYIGLDTGLLETFGGVSGFFRGITETVDSFCEDKFGYPMIDARDDGVASIVRDLYRLSPDLHGFEGMTMIADAQGLEWMGEDVNGYPEITPDPIERTFDVGILEVNGTVTVYSIEAGFQFPSEEPAFDPVSILTDERSIQGISEVLGIDEGIISAEVALRGSAEKVLRDAVERVMERLVSDAPEVWDRIWEGWEFDSPPPLDGEMCPTSFLASLTLTSIPDVIDELMTMLVNSPDLIDLKDGLSDLIRILGGPISDWVYENYETVVKADDQIEYALEDYFGRLPGSVDVDVISSNISGTRTIEEGYARNNGGKPLDIDEILEDPSILSDLGLNQSSGDELDSELRENIVDAIWSSIDLMKEREFGKGDIMSETGYIRKVLEGVVTRGGTRIVPGSVESLDLSRFRETVNDTIHRIITGVMNDTSGAEMMSASRHFLPSMNTTGAVTIRREYLPGHPVSVLFPNVNITCGSRKDPIFEMTGGFHDPDPRFEGSPYRTDITISNERNYRFVYSLNDSSPLIRELSIDPRACISVHTVWPLQGAVYEEGTTLYDIASNRVKQAAMEITERLLNSSTSIFSGTLSSLQEVPPLVNDMVQNGDLDLAEASRVLSNVSMDLSSTLRNGVKDLIQKLMEMGLTGVLSAFLDIIGVDEFRSDRKFGPLDLCLRTEKEALLGEKGTLIGMDMEVTSIGLKGYLTVTRVDNSSMKFNGTVIIEKGPLYIRVELDPFMEDRPHMVSVEGRFNGKDRNISFSFSVPALEEYKVTEVSLSSSLGVEPMIPIPPLGVNAVIDGGFRLRYRMPEDLPPALNEIEFMDHNISNVEIFDPGLHPFSGSTLELRSGSDNLICSWKIEGSPERYFVINLTRENMWRWKGPLPDDGNVHVVLRSPSGVIMDDLWLDDMIDGSIGRENDGYGVWRWRESTFGSTNGGSVKVSIYSLIVSLAFSAIREAWNEAYDLYGLSFDTLVHFLERTIDLFMERFLAMISELIVDARLFLKLEVEDASGSAGAGLELSLRAEGEAVALFLGWLYDNIKVLIKNIKDPKSSGNMVEFPSNILEKCWITLLVFTEVETPVSLENLAPEGTEIPDSLTYGITGSVNLALPLELMGKDIGSWHVVFGLQVLEAPPSIVSLFYDVRSFKGTTDLWLLKGEIWEDN